MPARGDHRLGTGLDLPAGRSTIEGDQALAFVRARKEIGDGSDLGRIDRQQAFASMVQKATSTGVLLNPVRLVGFLDAATKSVTTDPALSSTSALGSLANSLKDISTSGIAFVTVPAADRGDGSNLIWLDDQARLLRRPPQRHRPARPAVGAASGGRSAADRPPVRYLHPRAQRHR